MGIKRRIEYKLKHTPWILSTFIVLGSAFFKTVGVFVKTDPKLMLFTSFSGKQYNDSPKAIYEYMRSIPEGKQFKYVWAFEQPENFPQVDCEKVKIDTWKYFITTLKAKYWITSVNIERGLKYKKKDTFYLNTWHGPAINLMGNGVEGRSDFRWDHIDRFCIAGLWLRYDSPTIIGCAACFVMLFAKIEIKHIKALSFVTPSVFSVYLLNDHQLIRKLFITDSFIPYVTSNPVVLLGIIFSFSVLFFLCAISIDIVRRKIESLCKIKQLTIYVEKLIEEVSTKICDLAKTHLKI